MVNSEWLNSPTSQNHFLIRSNSSQIPKRSSCPQTRQKHHAASKKMQNAVWQKQIVWFVVVDKRHAHPGKTKLYSNTSKFTCKCTACSKWVSKTAIEVLVHKHHHQILCNTMQSPENNEKYIVPRCYPAILQQIQSCAQKQHCCSRSQIPHALSSCQRNVAHVHRINGSLYFHTPFCYDSHAAWLSKCPTCSTMHCICIHIIIWKPL